VRNTRLIRDQISRPSSLAWVRATASLQRCRALFPRQDVWRGEHGNPHQPLATVENGSLIPRPSTPRCGMRCGGEWAITSSAVLLLLWVFQHAPATGCVEFLLVDGSIIISIDLLKVHDLGSGVCLS